MAIIDDNLMDVLYNLSQLDIDTMEAYEQALKQIDDAEIHNRIID